MSNPITQSDIVGKLLELGIIKYTFPELNLCLDIWERDYKAKDIDEAADQVCWIFMCEWDCSLQEWVGMIE